MHARRRCGWLAASFARASSQPENEKPTTPADARVSISRRESCGAAMCEPRFVCSGLESCEAAGGQRVALKVPLSLYASKANSALVTSPAAGFQKPGFLEKPGFFGS